MIFLFLPLLGIIVSPDYFVDFNLSDVIRKLSIFNVKKNFSLLISKLTKFNLKNFNSHSNRHIVIRKYRAKIKIVAQ